MKNLKKLNRDQMKTVLGGVEMQKYNCQCSGQVGTWSGNYASQAAADADIPNYCRNGGSCGPAN